MSDVKPTKRQIDELVALSVCAPGTTRSGNYPVLGELHDLGLIKVTVALTDEGRKVIAGD